MERAATTAPHPRRCRQGARQPWTQHSKRSLPALTLLAVFAVCLSGLACTAEALDASTVTVEVNGVRLSAKDLPKDPVRASLFPAELEFVTPYDKLRPAVLSGTSSPFTYSIPVNLTLEAINVPNTPPVFGVVGDAMGALGFPGLCDIDHYLNHTAEPPCPERSGWATKLSADYGDMVPMFQYMIRSTTNAERVVVPLVFKQFRNDTTPLKLLVLAFGSKYGGLKDNFSEHLAGATQSFKARGIKVFLMTRPPVNPQPRAPKWMNFYNTTAAETLAQAVRDVAAQTDTPCFDVYNLFLALGDRWTEALGPDGVHYSPLGQQTVYEGLRDLIATRFPELTPQKLLPGGSSTGATPRQP